MYLTSLSLKFFVCSVEMLILALHFCQTYWKSKMKKKLFDLLYTALFQKELITL